MIYNFIKKIKLNSKSNKYKKFILLNIFLLSLTLNFSKKVFCNNDENIENLKLILCSVATSASGSYAGYYLSNTNNKYTPNIAGLASGLLLFKFYNYLHEKNQTKDDNIIKKFLENNLATFGLMLSTTGVTSYLTGIALE